MALYALNLFDLTDNEFYRQYSRRSAEAVGKHGGRVVALGRLNGVQEGESDTEPRMAMVLVEWPSRESFQTFLDDPEHADLHPLHEEGTRNYLWWIYERLEDLRPLFRDAHRQGHRHGEEWSSRRSATGIRRRTCAKKKERKVEQAPNPRG